ncbi:hypothetical protein [Mycolicibacterium pulveris]|uniref:hypothetical protein n=1 Tax=Mycolicibacterium pulveris TaxID=36813 RepID=UPI003CF2929B
MAKKRSPWASYHKQQRTIDATVFRIVLSSNHPCVCGHVQGFHWDTDDGKHTGKCVDAECPCEAFDEDTFAAAQLAAGVLPTVAAEQDEAADDDALARAMREHEQREVRADQTWDDTWDHAVHAKRPNPIGKPRRETLDDPDAMEALRQLGGSPDDLTG